MDYNLKMVFKI